jgi:hypothetical protein
MLIFQLSTLFSIASKHQPAAAVRACAFSFPHFQRDAPLRQHAGTAFFHGYAQIKANCAEPPDIEPTQYRPGSYCSKGILRDFG